MKTILTYSLTLLVGVLLAQSPEEKGLEIEKKADLADQGFESSHCDVSFLIVHAENWKHFARKMCTKQKV